MSFTYLFFLRFDPDFICNASDNSGRYSYKAQPAICRWNLVKLAEALAPELPPDRAKAVMEEYMGVYNGFYLENMRKKLGLLLKKEPDDEILITELLQTMHNTGGMRVTSINSQFIYKGLHIKPEQHLNNPWGSIAHYTIPHNVSPSFRC